MDSSYIIYILGILTGIAVWQIIDSVCIYLIRRKYKTKTIEINSKEELIKVLKSLEKDIEDK